MNNPEPIADTGLSDEVRLTPPLTPLSATLENSAGKQTGGAEGLAVYEGVRTPRLFDDPLREIDSLLSATGILDLGWRAKILVTGNDRVRWLNNMASNTIQGLPQDQGNYSFILNAQGRIQGDCYVYRRGEDFVIDTSRRQVPALLRHLQHYIIMDAVELQDVSEDWTALGLAGPKAPQILAALGVVLDPAPSPVGNARLLAASIGGVEIALVEAYHPLVPRYELWLPPAEVLTVWKAFQAAGAVPAGSEAAETLRVLEGTPIYGIDLNERDLPQETSQLRALNFTKGCYLGQEIVERIRSRGRVHRQFRQFKLDGAPVTPPFDLLSAGQTVGRITSTASLPAGRTPGNFALGFVREESLIRKAPIEYDGGVAIPLEAPPDLP
jgi:folate-binding protein YgfZ